MVLSDAVHVERDMCCDGKGLFFLPGLLLLFLNTLSLALGPLKKPAPLLGEVASGWLAAGHMVAVGRGRTRADAGGE